MTSTELRGPISVAVMGTGNIGMRHLAVLDQMPGVNPIAVPRREGRADELMNLGRVVARSVEEAASMGATLGIIASGTGQHLTDGTEALTGGLSILVEKPLARNSHEANQLAKCADHLGLKAFAGCVLRFSQSLEKFREMLHQVGRLHSVSIESQSYLPDWRPDRPYLETYSAKSDEGGVIRDLIHEIDYAGWIFGWPKSLQATIRNVGRLDINSDESADLIWETRKRCAVSLRLDYLSRPERRMVRAFGEHGTIEWDGVAQTVSLNLADCPPQVFPSDQTRDAMFFCQTLAFIESARGPVNPVLATAVDGVKALVVCDSARLASETRQEESVVYP